MTDRPRYGEYATPEEQRLLRGLPPVEDVAPQTLAPAPPPPARTGVPQESVVKPAGRPWDRVVTIGLLAYGVINVFMTGMSYLNLPDVMNQSMAILGIEGEFTNFAQGKIWGTVAAAVLVVGWVLTAWLSLRRLRTGRLTWWVPLVGAVATGLVASFCIAVPMMSDPAFIAYLAS
ncbi:CHASE2 domain-containing sensor protein [Microbacterium ginsengiterrae]|uniref:CHASE2 domain-containing sensor protein n=1 Tax=Microbacterium ginsengiterrae TaxID=546115 RepID=A0A7W9CDJ6_9MICO|nr:DUF6264 family protein [Microbacterium ginsengiterrae]MBB5743625.1 CHASE2 domain-containing sensor protein [Microbacterium ginsengiterrae]